MAFIDDNELILFHCRAGLSPERLEQIEREAANSELLRRRYNKLRATLAVEDGEAAPEPASGFEERLWWRLQARLSESAAVRSAASDPVASLNVRGLRDRSYRRWGLGWALAASVSLTFGAFFFARTPTVHVRSHQAQRVASPDVVAQRVLAMKIGEHLRGTEVVLLSVINSDSDALDPAQTEFIASLVESNRLYSAASARSGNGALAGFLRSLQPVLIELANRSGAGSIQTREGLREFLRGTDLLFRVRAVEMRVRTGATSA